MRQSTFPAIGSSGIELIHTLHKGIMQAASDPWNSSTEPARTPEGADVVAAEDASVPDLPLLMQSYSQCRKLYLSLWTDA